MALACVDTLPRRERPGRMVVLPSTVLEDVSRSASGQAGVGVGSPRQNPVSFFDQSVESYMC